MADAQDFNILVVEDEPDVQTFIKLTLENAGFRVRTASNGYDAYKEVKEETPDLISLDLVMPKNSGRQFYARLRKNKAWAEIPVVVVSAHAYDDLGESDFKELMKGKDVPPPQAFLEKPVEPGRLLNQIGTLLDIPDLQAEESKDERIAIFSRLKDADPETLRKVRDVLGS